MYRAPSSQTVNTKRANVPVRKPRTVQSPPRAIAGPGRLFPSARTCEHRTVGTALPGRVESSRVGSSYHSPPPPTPSSWCPRASIRSSRSSSSSLDVHDTTKRHVHFTGPFPLHLAGVKLAALSLPCARSAKPAVPGTTSARVRMEGRPKNPVCGRDGCPLQKLTDARATRHERHPSDGVGKDWGDVPGGSTLRLLLLLV
ncbi:hypothetical protein ZHAS_00010714 [Anopheles sinensis]|uniref:Uncharacterized protein n=1 Tax=Anopheles sinensis TaxID=74873 RepID=A0A084VYJ5_ANOSI|nr:hypothetical protein ZHAS_00010714 [Anopheles sinensis]